MLLNNVKNAYIYTGFLNKYLTFLCFNRSIYIPIIKKVLKNLSKTV